MLEQKDLFALEPQYITNNVRVCEDHFSEWSFTSTERKRLIIGALPETSHSPFSSPPLTAISYNQADVTPEKPASFSTGVIPSTVVPEDLNSTASQAQVFKTTETPATCSSVKSSTPTQTTKLINKGLKKSLKNSATLNSISKTSKPRLIRPSKLKASKPCIKSTQVTNLQKYIHKLKKKIQALKSKKPNFITQLKQKLTVDQYDIVMSQLKNGGRKNTGRRWSSRQKAFALNLYLQSPSAYRLLSQSLCIPSKSTLKRYLYI